MAGLNSETGLSLQDDRDTSLPAALTHLRQAIDLLCFLLILSFVVVVMAAVIFRYVLNASLPWSEEFIRFSLFWCIMLGAITITLRDQHLRIELVQDLVPPDARRILRIAAHASTVAFSLILLFQGLELIQRTTSTSPALGLPMWTVYAAMPVGAVGIGLGASWHLWNSLRDVQQ